MVERPAERAVVAAQHDGEHPLGRTMKAALLAVRRAPEQQRAHHRRRRQRDRQRDHDRDRQRHRELAEQAADDAAHQQDRDEHRDQRDAHRQHGEADLAGAADRGLHARHARLDVARDVLQHDDGVVDDEAGGDGERHQRQVVEAVAEQIHRREGADQRDRHRDARHQRRPAAAQEHEHHQHDEDHRDASACARPPCSEERIVVERSTAGWTIDRRRDRRPQLRQQRVDAVDGVDDVGAGLAVDDHQHRRLAVGEAGIAQVLDAVDDLADVGQADRRAVAVGDDQRAVFVRPWWPGRCRRSGSGGRRPRSRPSGCGRWRRRAPRARPRARCRICRARPD